MNGNLRFLLVASSFNARKNEVIQFGTAVKQTKIIGETVQVILRPPFPNNI